MIVTQTLRYQLEPLEPRIAPAVFVVSSLDDFDSSAGPDYVGTLRWAIAQTELDPNRKDTIRFDSDVFGDGATILLTEGQINISGNLVIQGLGADRVTIDAAGASRIFNITDGDFDVVRTVSITGVTFTGGSASGSGGAIFSNESLVISDVVFHANTATQQGGALSFISTGNLTISDSSIINNEAGASGGGVAVTGFGGSKVQIVNSLISGNEAGLDGNFGAGGGAVVNFIDAKSSLQIHNTDFLNNSGIEGGGLFAGLGDKGSAQIKQSVFSGNTAEQNGGGLLLLDFAQTGKLHLDKVTVAHNQAGDGGGLTVFGGSRTDLTIRNGGFYQNTAQTDLDEDTEGRGGAIFMEGVGNATLKNSVFAGNQALAEFDGDDHFGGTGGAIYAEQSTLNGKGLTFAGNSAFSDGGAVALMESTGVLSNSSFSGNAVFGGDGCGCYGNGGAIFAVDGDLAVSKVDFQGNSATQAGGALWFEGEGALSVVNSLFEGNRADTGGALAGVIGGEAGISKSNFDGNSAESAGALNVLLFEGSLAISKSTFHGNVSEGDAGAIGVFSVVDGIFSLEKSTVSNNFAAFDGGGLMLLGGGEFSIQKSTIAGNVAMGEGGGIFSLADTVEITKSKITGNLAGVLGGGVSNADAEPILLDRTTISGNFAGGDLDELETANIEGEFEGYLAPNLKAAKGTFVVTNLDDKGEGSLRQAIIDANDAGKKVSIVFDVTKTGKGTIELETELPWITAPVSINGPGADFIAISGDNNNRILTFHDGGDKAQKVAVSGLSLVDGKAFTGGAIFNVGQTLAVSDVMFWGNATTNSDGGAIRNDSGKLTISDSVFAGNTAGRDGGAISALSFDAITLRDIMVAGNEADRDGGGIMIHATPVFKSSGITVLANAADRNGGGLGMFNTAEQARWNFSNDIFTANLAGEQGGGLHFESLHIVDTFTAGMNTTMKGILASNNTANGFDVAGGGLFFSEAGESKVVVRDAAFLNNTATDARGGGIAITAINSEVRPLTIQNSVISGNAAVSNGGGIHVGQDGAASLKGLTLTGNSATAAPISFGGGLGAFSNGALEVASSTILGNHAENGGGIAAGSGDGVTIHKSTISGNSADRDGGGIFTGGTAPGNGGLLELNQSTLSGNTAGERAGGVQTLYADASIAKTNFIANSGPNGGGISHIFGDLTVNGGTFGGNTATFTGGAIHTSVAAGDTISLASLAIVRNTAGNLGGGILIGGSSDSQISVERSTFTGNNAGVSGGGLFANIDGATLSRSTLAGNTASVTGGGLGLNDNVTYLNDKSKITGNWASGDPNVGEFII